MRFCRSVFLASIVIAACSGKRPKTMLEFYYSIPFSDKYNETLSLEVKEKLFLKTDNGQPWRIQVLRF